MSRWPQTEGVALQASTRRSPGAHAPSEVKPYIVEPAYPFDSGAIYCQATRYSLQNMMIWQVNYPHQFDRRDWHETAWSDRIPMEVLEKACYSAFDEAPSITSFENGSLRELPDYLFLRFCAKIFRKLPRDTNCPTGGRVVRFTDAGGYPTYRIEGYCQHWKSPKPKTYTGDWGPNLIGPTPEEIHEMRRAEMLRVIRRNGV